jgi:glycerol kinase
MLFDVRHNVWDRELLAALHVPESVLPKVFPSAHRVRPHPPRPVRCADPDRRHRRRPAERALRPGLFHAGLAKNTYGTGCFLLMHVGERFRPSAHGLVTTSAAQPGATPEFALEGSVFVAGAVVQWLRDGLKCIEKSATCRRWRPACPTAAA